MPIGPDPSSPVGRNIPLQKSDIDRLRKAGTPRDVAAKAYDLDPGFRRAYDYYANQPDLDTVTRERLPELLMNRYYYGSWEMEPVSDLTATLSQPNPSKGFFGRVADDAKKRFNNALSSGEEFQKGNQTFPELALQTGGQMAGLAGDAIGQGLVTGARTLSAVTPDFIEQPIKDAGKAAIQSAPGQAVVGAVKSGVEAYRGFKEDNPRLARNVEAAANIASILPLPKAANVAGKVSLKAGDLAMDTAKAGAKVAGKKLAGTADNAASRLVQSALKLQPNDIRNFAKQGVGDGLMPDEYLLQKGLTGSIDDVSRGLEQIATQSKKGLDDGLKSIDNVFAISDEALPAGQALDFLRNHYKNFPTGNEAKVARISTLIKKKNITLSEMNEVKRLLDDADVIYRRSNDVKAGVTAEGLSNVRNKLKTLIEVEAEKRGFAGVKAMNKETQLSRELLEAIVKSETRRAPNNIVSLMDGLLGIGVAATIDPLSAVGVVGAKHLLGSPRFKMFLARHLSSLSKTEVKHVDDLIKGAKAPQGVQALKKTFEKAQDDYFRLGTHPGFAKIPGSLSPSSIDDAAQILGTTPDQLLTIVKGAGDKMEDIQAAVKGAFGSKFDELVSLAEDSGNIADLNFAENWRIAASPK